MPELFSTPYQNKMPATEIVTGRVSQDTMNYFSFQHLPHGWKNAVIVQVFEKLVAECKALGIPDMWEPGTEARISAIVSRLNFSTPATVAVAAPVKIKKPRKAKTTDEPGTSQPV